MARGDAVLTLLTKVEVKGAEKLNDLAGTMGRVGGKLTAGLTLPLLAAAGGMVKLAGEAAVSDAKLSAAFESMGAGAWTTRDALAATVTELDAMSSAFDDEAVQDFQAVLLTFGNVTGDVFTRAQKAGVNMAEALGTDLQSVAIQVGKALNDPEAGITALSRAGVTFSEDQKAMITSLTESGDLAGAQSIILAELERQFGGMSAAIAATPTGQFAEGMQQMANAGESLGAILLPLVTKVAQFVGGLAAKLKELTPEQQKWIVGIGALVAAIGPALLIGAKLVTAFNTIKTAFTALKLVMMANPWALLIVAVIALVTLIVMNWDTILAYLKRAWEWIKTAAGAVGKWLEDKFGAAVDFLVGLFQRFTPLGLIITHFDTLKTAVEKVREWIVDKFTAVMTFFQKLPERIGGFFSGLADTIKRPFQTAFNAIASLWNRTVGALRFEIPSWVPGIGGKGFAFPRIPELAAGGIITRPTLALLGEAGPEAVVPLGGRSQAAPAEIHLHLELGLASDPVEVGRQVVEAIRAYERSSGLAWRLGETG